MVDTLIKITGYVTRAYNSSFSLNIISDNVENEQGIHPNISKEIYVSIERNLYPDDFYTRFETVKKELEDGRETYEYKSVKKCLAICKGLRKGALVDCEVFVVNPKGNSDSTETYEISADPIHRENYPKYKLFLHTRFEHFKHLDGDTQETIKFRKEQYYTSVNIEKIGKITGSEWNNYRNAKWIDKNPKITFPMLWWVRVRTALSNGWKRFTKQENLLKVSLITNIILAFITAISVALNIWLLFFKKPSI